MTVSPTAMPLRSSKAGSMEGGGGGGGGGFGG